MDDVVAAVADPVRRGILELLLGGRLPAGETAGHFDISRPAVSRHLRVLRDAGLVHDVTDGRRRLYEFQPAPLAELSRWLDRMTGPGKWHTALDALETEVARTTRGRRSQPREHTA